MKNIITVYLVKNKENDTLLYPNGSYFPFFKSHRGAKLAIMYRDKWWKRFGYPKFKTQEWAPKDSYEIIKKELKVL